MFFFWFLKTDLYSIEIHFNKMKNPVLMLNSETSIFPNIMAIIFTMDVLKSKSSAVIEKKNINPANIGVVISVSKHMVWATLKIA